MEAKQTWRNAADEKKEETRRYNNKNDTMINVSWTYAKKKKMSPWKFKKTLRIKNTYSEINADVKSFCARVKWKYFCRMSIRDIKLLTFSSLRFWVKIIHGLNKPWKIMFHHVVDNDIFYKLATRINVTKRELNFHIETLRISVILLKPFEVD